MILDCLIQIQISLYMFEIQISVCIWKEGRKEILLVDSLLQIQIYVKPDLLIHPCYFSFLGTLCLCVNSQSLFLNKCVPLYLAFYFAQRDIICYFLSLFG